jgi:hypothetical protein
MTVRSTLLGCAAWRAPSRQALLTRYREIGFTLIESERDLLDRPQPRR